VLSNKPDADTVKVIEHYFPNYPFFEVYGQRKGSPVKPDPQSVLEIIDKLGYQKSNILYIGDTATDMQTAVNANLTAVGVLWGFRQKDELLKGGAEFIISHPSELMQIIEKRG
jgi:phosphoglycolate phosphatase